MSVGRRGRIERWVARVQRCLEQVDLIRLDHFRGFAAYWEVPADAETAVNGHWRPGLFVSSTNRSTSGRP